MNIRKLFKMEHFKCDLFLLLLKVVCDSELNELGFLNKDTASESERSCFVSKGKPQEKRAGVTFRT